MEIQSLGYIGVNSTRLTDWSGFAIGLLGMQEVDRGGTTRAYRMDDRRQRLIVTGESGEDLGFLGWEVADAVALDALAARLDAAGVAVVRGSRALAAARHVADLIAFADPLGNRLEVFHGSAVATDPFRPGRAISGFNTGPLGMGHAVMHVADVAPLLGFYRDLLGFAVSDYGLKPYPLYFFHVNGRHHSFAMVGSGRQGLHHFMVELCSLDDVGQGYDIAQMEEGRVAYTLGRHTNDHVTSFYSQSPSSFFVEYGWNGRVIDPATWQPHETHDGPSFWGHERLYLPEAGRVKLREMRMSSRANDGQRPKARPNEKPGRPSMRNRHLAAVCVAVLTGAALAGPVRAEIRGDAIKVGVLTDMTGVYSSNGGPGSVIAARMAAEEFGSAINGKPIVVLGADDQNKADIGVGIARQWFDRDGVSAIADLVPSPVALGVEDLVRQNHAIALISGAAAEAMFQESCVSTAFVWTQDTYSLANGTVSGVWQRTHAPWFFINADLGPALQLEQQARARLVSLGGTVVGSVKAPFTTTDFSSYLLQAQSSGAGVLAINTLGGTVTTVKQAVEFGLGKNMTVVLTTPKNRDIAAIGLPVAAGQLVVTSFYEDVSPEARAWSDKFLARANAAPSEVHAGVYSSVRHFLQAVKDTDSTDGEVVAARMRATPVTDAYTRDGMIRADGRMIHDMYLMRVKAAAESKGEWDVWEKVAVIPAATAFPPLANSRCPLVRKPAVN